MRISNLPVLFLAALAPSVCLAAHGTTDTHTPEESISAPDAGTQDSPPPGSALILPSPSLEICQDKKYLNAINSRLQREETMHDGDLEKIADFASQCQKLLLHDAGQLQQSLEQNEAKSRAKSEQDAALN